MTANVTMLWPRSGPVVDAWEAHKAASNRFHLYRTPENAQRMDETFRAWIAAVKDWAGEDSDVARALGGAVQE